MSEEKDKIKNFSYESVRIKCDDWYYKILEEQKYYKDDDEIIRYTSSPDIILYLFKLYENLLIIHLIPPFIILQSIELLIYNNNIRFLYIKPIYEFFYNNILIFLKIEDGYFNISGLIDVIVHIGRGKVQYQLLDLFLNMSEHFYSYDLNDINKIYYIDYNNQIKVDRICKTQNEFENCTPFYKIVMVRKYKKFNTRFFTEEFINYFGIKSLEINECLSFALRTYNSYDIESVKLLLSNNKKLNILYFIDIFTNTDNFSVEILDTLLSYRISNTLSSQLEKLWKLLSKVKLIKAFFPNFIKIDIEYENVSEIEQNVLDSIIYNYKSKLVNDNHYILSVANNFNTKLKKLEDFLLDYI